MEDGKIQTKTARKGFLELTKKIKERDAVNKKTRERNIAKEEG